LLALLSLPACTRTIYVDRPRLVEVPVPVYTAIPAELTADCPPEPLTGTTVGDVLGRLRSVELALAQCRGQLGLIRAVPNSVR
jgi:hypothetical protein